MEVTVSSLAAFIDGINAITEVLHCMHVAVWEFSNDLPHSERCISDGLPVQDLDVWLLESWEFSIC